MLVGALIPVATTLDSPRTVAAIEPRGEATHPALSALIMLVTEQCNLRCDYCYIDKAARAMTVEIAERSVDFLFENADPTEARLSICFFGGEPLLQPDLVEHIAEYAHGTCRRKLARDHVLDDLERHASGRPATRAAEAPPDPTNLQFGRHRRFT